MRPTSVLAASVLALTALLASDARAQAPTCETVEYAPAVLERAPNAKQVCLRIVEKDGKTYAVTEAVVTRVNRNSGVSVRFKLPDGSKTPSRYFRVAPDRRVLIEGKPTMIRDLVVGQELTLYVDVKTPEIATEPVVADAPIEVVPLELAAPPEETDVAAEMPKTASPLGAIGLSGLGFLLLAAGMRRTRRS